MASEEKASQVFYELCYDQYKLELEEAEKLYQKAAIILIILPILVGTVISIGRTDLVEQFFVKKVVFLYYLSCFFSWTLILSGVIFAIYCVVPRNYQGISNLAAWQDWRKRYQEYIEKSKASETVDDAMIIDICTRLADALARNQPKSTATRLICP